MFTNRASRLLLRALALLALSSAAYPKALQDGGVGQPLQTRRALAAPASAPAPVGDGADVLLGFNGTSVDPDNWEWLWKLSETLASCGEAYEPSSLRTTVSWWPDRTQPLPSLSDVHVQAAKAYMCSNSSAAEIQAKMWEALQAGVAEAEGVLGVLKLRICAVAANSDNVHAAMQKLRDYSSVPLHRRVVDNFIAAANQTGLAACYNTFYYNSQGEMVAAENKHAGIRAVAYNSTSDGSGGSGLLSPPDPTAGGSVKLSYNVGATAQCQAWNSSAKGWVADGSLLKYASPYLDLPNGTAAYQNISSALCSEKAAAAPLLARFIQSGGDAAVVALAAMTQANCSDPAAAADAQQAYINSTLLTADTATAMQHARNLIAAAHDIGLAGCITLSTLDGAGSVVDEEKMWTEGRVPGLVKSVYSWRTDGRCDNYNAASEAFELSQDAQWGAAGGITPPNDQVQELASRACELKDGAGPLLYQALIAGGANATAAAASLLTFRGCSQTNMNAAANALFTYSTALSDHNIYDLDRRIALQFVRAADAIGQPFCITLAALDPVRKQVLHTKQAHTGMGLNLTLLADTTQAQQDDASSTTSASSGTNVGAIVGGVAGGLVLACAALAGALMYRRTRRQAEAASGAKPVGAAAEHAGGGGGGSSRLLGSEPEEDLATVPTKPHGSGPMALPSWLAQTSSGSQPVTPPAHDFFLSYVTSLAESDAQATLTGGSGSRGGQARSSGGSNQLLQSWEIAFNELKLLRPIGQGSFGRVYEGVWNHSTVAVKILLVSGKAAISTEAEAQQSLALPPGVLEKLDEEAGILARLRHNNVVNFYGVCHAPACIVTEICERGSLVDLLAAGRRDAAAAAALPWQRRLSMALDAALGMLYLHSRPQPIIHRDLKSPNLLVDAHYRVKVTDFNLSRILEDSSQRQSSAGVLNPRWLAPEVMRGGQATKAADVFSFGVVLWELLTFEVPWGASNAWQIVSSVLAGGRLEVPLREGLPGGAELVGLDVYVALLRSCWAQQPTERPTFEEVILELRALLHQAAGGARRRAGLELGTAGAGTAGLTGSLESV